MNRLLSLLTAIILLSCNSSSSYKEKVQQQKTASDSTEVVASTDSSEHDTTSDSANHDIESYFVVVADTGASYYDLHHKMFALNKQLHIPIDTMNRYYNSKKNLIALHENDEDKLYAGQYFPRRFPSESLSLEYLDVYQDEAGKKTIALVSGIYETKKSADSALAVLKTAEKNAFKIKAEINVGCAH